MLLHKDITQGCFLNYCLLLCKHLKKKNSGFFFCPVSYLCVNSLLAQYDERPEGLFPPTECVELPFHNPEVELAQASCNRPLSTYYHEENINPLTMFIGGFEIQ